MAGYVYGDSLERCILFILKIGSDEIWLGKISAGEGTTGCYSYCHESFALLALSQAASITGHFPPTTSDVTELIFTR